MLYALCTTLALLSSVLWLSAQMPEELLLSIKTPAAGGAPTYLFEADFEDGNPPPDTTDYHPTGGSVAYNDTTATVLRGTYQMKVVGGDSDTSYMATPTFSGATDTWLHMRVKFADATPAAAYTFCVFRVSSTTVCSVRLNTTGYFGVNPTGGSTTYDSTVALSDNTKYHVWIKYHDGGGANSAAYLYISTDQTRPADPQVSVTNGTGSGTPTIARFTAVNPNVVVYYDQLLIDDAEISSVAE